jgi:cytochrome c5
MRKLMLLTLVAASSLAFAEAPSGQKIYEAACRNCHAPLVSNGIKAPSAHDQEAWNARFKVADAEVKAHPDRYKDAFDYLIQQVKKGKGLMHHGGLCKESVKNPEDCTPEAYRAAIEFMRSAEAK